MTARRTRIKGITNIPQRNKPGISLTKVGDLRTNSQLSSSTDEKNDKEERNLSLQHVVSEQRCTLALDSVSKCHGQSMFKLQIFGSKEQDILVPQVDAKVALQATAKTEQTIEQLGYNRNSDNLISKPSLKLFEQTNFRNEHNLQNTQIVKCEQDKIEVESVILVKHTQNQDLSEIPLAKSELPQNNKVISEKFIKFEIPQSKPEEITLSQKMNLRRFIKPPVSLKGLNREVKGAESNLPKSKKTFTLNEIITSSDSGEPLKINTFNQRIELEHCKTLAPISTTSLIKESTVEESIEKPVEKSFNEQLISPRSPSKVNRTRIKAVPRLGEHQTSFSVSESEDKSRRNGRHRNHSICPTMTGLQHTNSMECLSSQKPREFNLTQKKCPEKSRKLADARHNFYLKFGNQKPDKEQLTMIDFIFYNPTTNLMTNSKSKNENEEVEEKQDEEENGTIEDYNGDNTEKQTSDEEDEVPAPQIKIGANGEIEIDEQSLTIENRATKKSREKMEKQKIIDADLETGYGIYKRAKRSKRWNKDETSKFYKALKAIGTDFDLMCELFPLRSRRELKLKFKKEERSNKVLIDQAMIKLSGFNFNDLKNEIEMEEQELKEVEKQKERELQMKKEIKKRKLLNSKTDVKDKVFKIETAKPLVKKKKPFDIMRVLDDNSDADASESGSNSIDSV